MKSKVELPELDSYALYLRGHLIDHQFPQKDDEKFIAERATLANETFEELRRAGHAVTIAQELAMRTLLNGLYVSRYDIIYTLFEEQLWLRVPEELWPLYTEHFLANQRVHIILDRYAVNGDFLSRDTHQPMFDELLGLISEILDDYEL